MQQKEVSIVMSILEIEVQKLPTPIVSEYAIKEGRNPFKALISTVLSLRTKDSTTSKATDRLFALADNPKDMVRLSIKEIENAIYPVGFYITKAKRISEICKILLERFAGKVPDEIDVLLTLPGVGRKTANLVVIEGFGKPGICVDVHVHVIANRLGLVRTKNADETEFALRKILPEKYWIILNKDLVAYGQNICTTAYPKCGKCVIEKYCVYDKKELSRF